MSAGTTKINATKAIAAMPTTIRTVLRRIVIENTIADSLGGFLAACPLFPRAENPFVLYQVLANRRLVRVVTVVAAFHAATPGKARAEINILSPIQPVVVSWALRDVYARLVHRVRVPRHSDEHVISVDRVISNTATFKTAMVGRLGPGIRPGTARLVLHQMVVT